MIAGIPLWKPSEPVYIIHRNSIDPGVVAKKTRGAAQNPLGGANNKSLEEDF
jgi:hypothetical protein